MLVAVYTLRNYQSYFQRLIERYSRSIIFFLVYITRILLEYGYFEDLANLGNFEEIAIEDSKPECFVSLAPYCSRYGHNSM